MSADRLKTEKDVTGKSPLSRIPREALELEAQVFAFGAKKYAWNGFKETPPSVHQLLDALMRHAVAMANGEDVDPESGISHIGHMRCCTSMLAWVMAHRPDKDDRYGKQAPVQEP